MGELVAVRCEPEVVGAALRRIWEADDAALLLPSDAPAPAVEAILASQRPAALLDLRPGGSGVEEALPGALPTAEGVALVVTTSGSTGRPKGVELTHAALRASTTASLARLGCRPRERWALTLPPHHVAGLQVVLRSAALGTDAEVVADLAELARSEAHHVSLVPTQLRRLLDTGADVSRFATILLGGARADAALLARARAAGANVVVSYGMSETGGGCVYDGRPLDGVEVDVIGGRIRLRGPVLFRGYRGEPSESVLDDEGWFTTGDLGRLTGERLEVLGRADDVVVTGGENVPVTAVEDALADAPGVADVAVVGRADDEWGERLVAVVVPSDPDRPPTLELLRAHVRRTHPAAYAPRSLLVIDALPRDPMGKLSRAAVRRAAARS